tara:strand:+ start:163 stop:828 length:666 start_codon:yes stop_codon:yes gene_type:complete
LEKNIGDTMILDLEKMISKYNLNITGVIHIGAHIGQEYDTYQNNNIDNYIFIEPLEPAYSRLLERVSHNPNAVCVKTALGNFNGTVTMNTETANQGMSSSILSPRQHLDQYPDIVFDGTQEVPIQTLDSLGEDLKVDITKYNFINIDIQGYELEAFKGAKKCLETIEYIMTEVNRDEVYENCCKVDELDNFLKGWGFTRRETDWHGGSWGDSLYIKGGHND